MRHAKQFGALLLAALLCLMGGSAMAETRIHRTSLPAGKCAMALRKPRCPRPMIFQRPMIMAADWRQTGATHFTGACRSRKAMRLYSTRPPIQTAYRHCTCGKRETPRRKRSFPRIWTAILTSRVFAPILPPSPSGQGVQAKGAVVLLAGGAFQMRGNYTDTLPTAAHLRELGFHTFIVDYRLRPYTQQEGALDVARAVRFIRKNADVYGIDPDDIAVMGYSAGGIQAGEFFLNFDGDVNGTALDPDYVPDALDEVEAHASAAGMVYSFYGRLSVASMDVDALRAGELPPTFYVYGTEDPFYGQFEAQSELLRDEVGVPVRRLVLQDWPHGFGGDGGWVEDYAAWLEAVFASNDQ